LGVCGWRVAGLIEMAGGGRRITTAPGCREPLSANIFAGNKSSRSKELKSRRD